MVEMIGIVRQVQTSPTRTRFSSDPVPAGIAVVERVMDLGVGGEAAALEPLNQVELPKRVVPVERLAVQPRHQLQQLAHPPGPRQRRQPDVVLQVEVVLLGPPDVAKASDRVGGPLSQPRVDRGVGEQLVVQPADMVRVGGRRQLVDGKAGHMRRLRRGFPSRNAASWGAIRLIARSVFARRG